MFRIATLSLTLLLSSFTLACGGGGISDGTSVAELSAAENQKLCEDIKSDIYDQEAEHAFLCYYAALAQSAGNPQVDCQSIADTCLAEPSEDSWDCDTTEEDIENQPECASEITVGELRACMEDLLQQYQLDIDCDTDLETISLEELPATCQAVEEECPGFLTDEG